MIIFKQIRYKNFLSTGNEFTKIDLNRSKSTLICGKNGHGKTTMISAIVFALFGRAYAKVNKPQLVNSITRKNLVTEIDFSIGSNDYMVRRGIKPNLFEIYQNDELIDIPEDLKEYQDMLEKTILKINYKSFCQVVVLGSTNYVPFMELSAGDRRTVVEDLLDIQIFTKMNSILKQEIDEHKSIVHKNEHEINLLNQKIDLLKKHMNSLKENNDEILNQKKESIDKINQSINVLESKNNNLLEQIQNLTSIKTDTTKLISTIEKLKEFKFKFDSKISSSEKAIKFFSENENCPTCKQSINDDFRNSEISKKKDSIDKTKEALSELLAKFNEASEKLSEANKTINEISTLNSEVKSNTNTIKNYKSTIETLNEEIEKIKNKTTDVVDNNDEIEKLSVLLNKKIDYKYKLDEQKKILDESHHFLKDSGIKTKFISKYIPIINQHVNQYLHDLDFFVNFQLDENFNEKILSRNRDDFTFSSFSEGEKMRLNLALLFSWRAIAKKRNSASTNLLIMDEVADSSLDEEGIQGFLKIIDNLGSDTNVFLISHHGDAIYDKFHSVIKIEKVNNFSRIASE